MQFKSWIEQNEDKLLILMRGLSGSGKSTLAREISKKLGGVIYSTDDFLEGDKPDDYKANFAQATELGHLPALHLKNQDRTQKAMISGTSPIIIDNTNVEKWHLEPYVELAKKHGYRVEFAAPQYMQDIAKLAKEGDSPMKLRIAARQLSKRNVHGVPVDAIMKQLEKWHHDPKIEDF
jgi:predicted kinase